MSQNNHSLLLFFDKAEKFKACFSLFKAANSEDQAHYRKLSEELGIDLGDNWGDAWFNIHFEAKPKYISLNFDTSTSNDLTLDLLESLFSIGLRAACVEVFYDQVGEYSQHFFFDGRMVARESLFKKSKLFEEFLENEFECDSDDLEEEYDDLPINITELRALRDEQQEEAAATADAMMDMFAQARKEGKSSELLSGLAEVAMASKETGEDPVDIIKSALVIREAIKGLLQALAFGLVTILLFKGLWLWIILTVLLVVLLPIIYVGLVSADFEEDEDEEGSNLEGKNDAENSEEGEAC